MVGFPSPVLLVVLAMMSYLHFLRSVLPCLFTVTLLFGSFACLSLGDDGDSPSESEDPDDDRRPDPGSRDDETNDGEDPLDDGLGDDENPDGENPDDEWVPDSCGPGRVEGRVCAPDTATWLGGARVVLSGSDCEGVAFEHETISDSDGYFTFEDIPAGEHLLVVSMGSFNADYLVRVYDGETTNLTRGEEKVCLDDEGVRIGVVAGSYDSIETILDSLAVDNDVYEDGGYSYYGYYDYYGDEASPAEEFLLDPALLAEYDIIMFNCGEHYLYWGYDWETYDEGPSAKVLEMAANIRGFVDGGGSLYVSDLAYWIIELAYPEALRFSDDESNYSSASRGAITTTTATVVDSGLATALGHTSVTIDFPLQGWVVAEGTASYAHPLLEGNASLLDYSTLYDAALLVSFQPSPTAGTVFFTSFHNESQLEEDIERILHYVIFSL